MTKTITIVARDRRSNPDGDSVIQQLKDKLEARRDKQNHLVAEAPTVEHLRDQLDQLSEQIGQPDRVQIVGHGTSGMLSLGYHWGHRYSDGPEGLFYVLDANHFVYGVLAGAVKRPTEVCILGCSVGDNGQRIQSGVARGRTLLFDLSQMWECVVRAPASVISADDFDSEGIFAHPRRLNSVDGETFEDATELAPMPHDGASGANLAEVHITRLRRAPILGPRVGRRLDLDLSSTRVGRLCHAYSRKLRLPPLLALPEVIFDAKWNGANATCELLGNGRVLRLTCRGAVHHFEAQDGDADALHGEVQALLIPALGTSLPW